MYKTIVVHVDGSPLQESRLAAAALLANEHGAHLVGTTATGITWRDYVLLTGSMGAPVPDPDADFRGLREAAAARLDEFTRQAAALGVASVEGSLIEYEARYALQLQARYADLVVLSQDGVADPRAAEPGLAADMVSHARHLPESVALHGARPVLVVPQVYRGEALSPTAVAGWDGSLQATRAIAAALPLLRHAASVKLAVVNPDQQAELHGEQPGADMALYLARHGVPVDVVVERTRATAGEALIGIARDCGASLMVSGAYGHGRYREWVLGGVTRELLERAVVPLLISH